MRQPCGEEKRHRRARIAKNESDCRCNQPPPSVPSLTHDVAQSLATVHGRGVSQCSIYTFIITSHADLSTAVDVALE